MADRTGGGEDAFEAILELRAAETADANKADDGTDDESDGGSDDDGDGDDEDYIFAKSPAPAGAGRSQDGDFADDHGPQQARRPPRGGIGGGGNAATKDKDASISVDLLEAFGAAAATRVDPIDAQLELPLDAE